MLSPKQRQLATWWSKGSQLADCDGIIAEGAVRSGKTWAMVTGFLLWSQCRFSHQSFIVAGRTMGALKRNVVQPMLRALSEFGWPCSYNRSEGIIRVGTNRYHLFGASNEQSQDTIQGMTAAGCLLDEVALMPRSFVDQALARCSVAGSKFWWDCNPSYPAHFVKAEFIDKYDERNLAVMRFSMEDNPTLAPEVRERYERLYSGVFYDRYIRGLWVLAEGLVYQLFDRETMCAELDEKKKKETPHFLSIDYGITNPFVALDWVVIGGKAYCVDEYCFDSDEAGCRRTDEEHYRALRDKFGKRYVEGVVVDPSATSFIETVRRHGEWDVTGADNAVTEGISRVCTALKTGCLLVSANCRRLLEEFGLYRWDERKQRETVVKENDHACDAMRYFVSTVGVNVLECFAWD